MNETELKAYASYLAEYFGMTLGDLVTKNRSREIAYPRQQIMAFLRTKSAEYNVTHSRAAAIFNRDHATALHSVKAIENELSISKKFVQHWDKFCAFGNAYVMPEVYELVEVQEKEPYQFMDKHSL
jgi:chromosomal replication initiation ATPase DnaA